MDISFFCLGRLYCFCNQRKSKGERIISWLIPTLVISQHSLPQLLIYRRVNFFSLFSLFGVTNSLFPLLLLFRRARHYHYSFPEKRSRRRTPAVKFPGEDCCSSSKLEKTNQTQYSLLLVGVLNEIFGLFQFIRLCKMLESTDDKIHAFSLNIQRVRQTNW